ncbi:hypothetical protein F4819DRAFT_23265 [Hypoxylon fuscum]|nr:hypothetical protein F4819DRAFT_23265 [Hypoxylon fuscum]
MADYHISVRDYHWSHQNAVVQSPILDLDSPTPTLVVRPLEGVNEQEPRKITSVADLIDDIHEEEYQAEAHGVLVSANPEKHDNFPVWVPVHGYKCKENETHIVNLVTFEAHDAPVSQICWVPNREGPDDRLYTIIGAPRKALRATWVLVVVQTLGYPGEAKLALVDPSELAGYDMISDTQKKKLFEIQLSFIQSKIKRPSTTLLEGYRIYSSPDRDERGRRTLDEVLGEDLEVPRPSYSDCSSQGSVSGSSDDDYIFIDKPTYVSIVDVSSRLYSCDCRYVALRPTCANPRPSHRHGTDDECSLGSTHPKHCIFADHKPTQCVISGSREQHEHCVPLSRAIKLEFEEFEQLDFADANALLHEQAESGLGTAEAMDFEPTLVDSPSMDFQSLPDIEPDLTYHDESEPQGLEQFHLPDAGAAFDPHQGSARNPGLDLAACASPEPPDMQL